MKIIYIAGPYSGLTEEEVQDNIQVAEKYAVMLADMGIGFICPHKNTANFHFLSSASYEFYMKMCLTILKKSDAILFIPDWECSKGSKREFASAKKLKMPMFFPKSLDDVDVFDEIKKFAGR